MTADIDLVSSDRPRLMEIDLDALAHNYGVLRRMVGPEPHIIAALLVGLQSRANAICPGHLLYGRSPVLPGLAELGSFEPVLKSIKSCLIHVHMPQNGSPRGLPRRVGVIPIGVADGYQPIPSGAEGRVLIAGRSAPIIGVSLETMSLDLSDLDGARIGDEVVLLGASGDQRIAIDELASWQAGRPHRVLLAFDRRLPRRYLEGSHS